MLLMYASHPSFAIQVMPIFMYCKHLIMLLWNVTLLLELGLRIKRFNSLKSMAVVKTLLTYHDVCGYCNQAVISALMVKAVFRNTVIH